MSTIVEIEGVPLHLAHPDEIPTRWIGNERVREQLIAAWMVVAPTDVPLNPRLIGRPGVGKTTLAYSVARSLGQEVYILQCTMDTRPEDLLVTPVIAGAGAIAYHASPLVTAMIRGGICILDEGNRMSEKSWASLAPLLDMRRTVESIVAGIKIVAHKDFRVCVTMNDDASTYEIPEYIHSRLQPQIEVTFPARSEEIEILRFNVPFAEEKVVEYVADFLQKAHAVNLGFSSRDGVNILRYATKIGKRREAPPETFLAESIEAVLGREGVAFLDSGLPADRMQGAFGTLREFLEGPFEPGPDDEDDDLFDDKPF
jgi:Mg-chelatase subunit ChlI